MRYLLGVMRRNPLDAAVVVLFMTLGVVIDVYMISMATMFILNISVAKDFGRHNVDDSIGARVGKALSTATSYCIACAGMMLILSKLFTENPTPMGGIVVGFAGGVSLCWYGLTFALTHATSERISRVSILDVEVERLLRDRRAQRKLDEEDALNYGEVRSSVEDRRFDRAMKFAKRIHNKDLKHVAIEHIKRASDGH